MRAYSEAKPWAKHKKQRKNNDYEEKFNTQNRRASGIIFSFSYKLFNVNNFDYWICSMDVTLTDYKPIIYFILFHPLNSH